VTSSRTAGALLRIAAALLFVMLAGATYQGAATALERRQFPHPGRLVNVGDHQLHIYCVGEGTPTVVLEAPAAGMSASWGWVQPAIARTTRACSYDRAGLGWSETGTTPYDPSRVADQLHTLLERAGEHGPYVLVGQGLGAAFATIYSTQYGSEVHGLVLVDPPDARERPARPPATMRVVPAWPWLARAGVLRVTRLLTGTADGLPAESAARMRAFLNRPDHLTRAARELSRWDDAVRLAAAAPIAAEVPVRRLEAGGRDRVAFLTDSSRAAAVTSEVVGLARRLRK
jgi:pimeloyl-ACP methyl ester carboxylesterase